MSILVYDKKTLNTKSVKELKELKEGLMDYFCLVKAVLDYKKA